MHLTNSLSIVHGSLQYGRQLTYSSPLKRLVMYTVIYCCFFATLEKIRFTSEWKPSYCHIKNAPCLSLRVGPKVSNPGLRAPPS